MTAQRSHNDIYREIGAASQQIEALEVRADNHDAQLEAIKVRVDANGVLTADAFDVLKAMREDIAAIKAKVLAWEMFKARVIGAASVAAAAIASGASFVWWLVGDKIAHFFKGAAP